LALSWLCGAADLRCARGLVARASSRACVPNLRTGAVAGAWCLPCRERPSERADLSAIASAPSWTCTGHAVHGCASMRSFCRARAPSWAPSGPVLAMLRACPGSSLVIYRAWAPSRARRPGAVASTVASAQSWPGTGLCCLLASGIYCARGRRRGRAAFARYWRCGALAPSVYRWVGGGRAIVA
jgi:hypothetical protein